MFQFCLSNWSGTFFQHFASNPKCSLMQHQVWWGREKEWSLCSAQSKAWSWKRKGNVDIMAYSKQLNIISLCLHPCFFPIFKTKSSHGLGFIPNHTYFQSTKASGQPGQRPPTPRQPPIISPAGQSLRRLAQLLEVSSYLLLHSHTFLGNLLSDCHM